MQLRPLTAAALLTIVALQFSAASPAAADDTPVLVADGDKVTLTAADGAEATASITLENQGTTAVQVGARLRPGAATGCRITPPDDATLKPHRQQKLTFTFSAACDPDREQGTDFTVTAGVASFDLHADAPTTADPNWWAVLIAYLGLGVVAALVLLVTYRKWETPRERAGEKKVSMPLPGLDSSWKFSDSWAANATVVTALFTGLFGAKEVTTALLGEGTSDLLAVALVSAAVSVGLAGLSPMVLQALRTRSPKIPEKKDADGNPIAAETPAGLYVTPLGLLLAAFLTITATGGQLAALLYALTKTDFGSDWAILILGLAAGLLLFWYAAAATDQNLTTGATLAPPTPPAPVAQASAVELPAGVADRAFAPGAGPVIAVLTPAAAVPSVLPARPSGVL